MNEHKVELTISRPDFPDLPVTLVAHTKLLHVDVAIALLHGAREALQKDIGNDGKTRTVKQQAGINTLMHDLRQLSPHGDRPMAKRR